MIWIYPAKLGNTTTESYRLLTYVFRKCPRITNTCFWVTQMIRRGSWRSWRQTTCGSSCSSKTDISKINEIARKCWWLGFRMTAEMTNILMRRQILHDQMNMTKVCAKICRLPILFIFQHVNMDVGRIIWYTIAFIVNCDFGGEKMT